MSQVEREDPRVTNPFYIAQSDEESLEICARRAQLLEPDYEPSQPTPDDLAAFALAKMRGYQNNADMMEKIFLELKNWE